VTSERRIGDVVLGVAAVTDPGLKRKANEDSYLAESPVFLVADGMGGYEAGDRASAAVVEAFRTVVRGPGYPTLDDVRAALVAADAGVAEVAATTQRGAGSTVSGVVLVEHEDAPHWLVFNVGDSRVYRHDGSVLEQLTVDHSLGQELIDRGELAREDLNDFADRNVITRAIGASDSTADSWLMPVTNGERLMLCSDGLSSEVGDEGIRAILTMSGRPESAAAALVQRAKDNGGHDNITVVVLDVVSGGGDVQGEYTTGALTGPSDDLDDDTTIPVGVRGGR
jgi:serine/threonine protein phosphatase PrpC